MNEYIIQAKPAAALPLAHGIKTSRSTLLERIIFYPPGQVICSSATTLMPMHQQGYGGKGWRMPATVSLLNQKAHDRHYHGRADAKARQQQQEEKEERPKIVFASRNSATVLHGRKLVNEEQVLASVRRMMEVHNRPEDLVVYTGDGVGYDDQFHLFSTASLIIGPHGSAMSNVLWSRARPGCQSPVHVVEFVGSRISGPRIQDEYHGYYRLEGSVPWVNYHMLTFQENSTKEHTSVDTRDVESVLSWIWGGERLRTAATRCYAAVRR